MKIYTGYASIIGALALDVGVVVGHDSKVLGRNKGFLEFEEYLQKYGKNWVGDEYNLRRSVYQQNLQRIHDHNRNRLPSEHMLDVDQFTDMEPHEVSKGYDKSQKKFRIGEGMYDPHQQHSNLESLVEKRRKLENLEQILGISLQDPVESLPLSIDWRKRGVSTPVKSQGMCGSCWAFASTAVLESHLAIQTGKLYELSVQELVSCAPNQRRCGGSGGCAGSTSELAFAHVQERGMVTEWEFGYQSYRPKNGTVECSLSTTSSEKQEHLQQTQRQQQQQQQQHEQQQRSPLRRTLGERKNTSGYYNGAVMGIGGWISLPSNNYVAVMNAVAKLGPLAVSVACNPWFAYQSGVFAGANFSNPSNNNNNNNNNNMNQDSSSTDVNHLVVLEGYGTDAETGQDFWLVRNSWGPNWGENGYIRLLRSPDASCGMDVTPSDGVACTRDHNGKEVIPPNALICGNSGILYDVTIPIQVFEITS
ncbi:hypothetical protein ACA910_007893 [Epithemia clementina (nom. ined.)]